MKKGDCSKRTTCEEENVKNDVKRMRKTSTIKNAT